MPSLIENLKWYASKKIWPKALDGMPDLLNQAIEKLSQPIDWPSISNEDFIAEAQRRVTQFSPDRYMSPNQSDDRAKLDVLRSRIIVAKVASIHAGENHPALIALASLCDELDGMSGNPLPKPATAINTILPGKTDIYQDHSPKEYVP